jgi:hypothetical protein
VVVDLGKVDQVILEMVIHLQLAHLREILEEQELVLLLTLVVEEEALELQVMQQHNQVEMQELEELV